MSNLDILFIILGIITLGLSIYLGILVSKLRAQNRQLKSAKEQAEENRVKRDNNIKESLSTIALALIQDQCGPTEGCIRIKKLIDEIEYLKERDELNVFHQMYEEVREFATHQEYKDLSKQEAFKQDSARFKIEHKYLERIKEASKDLRNIIAKPH